MREEQVMTNPTSLRSQIKSLEAQLRVLYALVQPSTTSASKDVYSLADLEGLLQGQTDTTEVDIDAILYQGPPDRDEDI
jgi:hypothetical protein